jgi:hypothetical protein
MAVDDTRIGPAGEVLAASIRRIRTAQRLAFAELSRELDKVGRPIPELGLRRIERGERRVDYDDLLALAYVLRVCPVDLMVSSAANDDDPYPVIPAREFKVGSVREWVSGTNILLVPPDPKPRPDGGTAFASPGRSMYDALQWMPTARRKEVTRDWLDYQDEGEQS